MLTRRPLAVLAALGRRGDRLAAEAFARVDNLLVEPGEVLADPRTGPVRRSPLVA
jgi:hypothetical protein